MMVTVTESATMRMFPAGRRSRTMRNASQRGGDPTIVRRSVGLWWILMPCAVATVLPSSSSSSTSTTLAFVAKSGRDNVYGESSRVRPAERVTSDGSAWKSTALWIRGGSESPKRKSKAKKSKKEGTRTSGESPTDAEPKGDSVSKEDRGTEISTKNSKKKKKKKTPVDGGGGSGSDAGTITNHNKAQINQVLKETDAAQALGDAIRARADVLLRDDAGFTGGQFMDPSLSSLAWSLGASDYASRRVRAPQSPGSPAEVDDEATEDSGGVEVAPGAVVASYFLKSHGGAHALQSLCSLLSATAGIGVLALSGAGSTSRSVVALTLLRRSLVFALVKHVSGLLAAAWISAMAIPDVGFVRARSWMQQLALDPVSQYCFYTSLILVWLPSTATKAVGATAASPVPTPWWQQYPFVTLLLLGPILLREVISTALVACDVLALLSLSSGGSNRSVSTTLLRVAGAVGNAGFSILVTPKVWRNASASQRQQLLAKLVQKCSLAFEVAVGVLLVADALRGGAELLFAAERPSLVSVARRSVCANLYVQFLLTRRRKIKRLAAQIRGGAAHVPGYVLDVLLDPVVSMGIQRPEEDNEARRQRRSTILAEHESGRDLTWREFLWLALEQD